MELPRAWQRPDPLRGLDRISWVEVYDGRGGAGRVPRLLRSLMDSSADVRLDALSSLADRLLTDDTVSEASFCAVPYLVELGASYKVAADVRDRVIFLLAAMADKFHLLNYGLAVILVFIGAKMLLVDVVKVPPMTSLGVVVGILAITMVWSLQTAPRPKEASVGKNHG